jgi:hypothetical protein
VNRACRLAVATSLDYCNARPHRCDEPFGGIGERLGVQREVVLRDETVDDGDGVEFVSRGRGTALAQLDLDVGRERRAEARAARRGDADLARTGLDLGLAAIAGLALLASGSLLRWSLAGRTSGRDAS